MKRLLLYILLMAFGVANLPVSGQNGNAKCRRSTEGKEFWFGFMESRNYNNQHRVEITVTAREDANFSVYIGKSNTPSHTGTVSANNKVQVVLDWKLVEATGSEQIQEKAIRLVSDKPVNLYALNWDANSSDVAVIYPLESLGKEYYAMCYEPNVNTRSNGAYGNGRNSEFLIVATVDSTIVRIKPSKVTDKLRPKDSVFTVTLQKGEVYQVQSENVANAPGQGDLTGSYVTSDKPIAFYSGSLSTTIPKDKTAWDHLYEQIPPVNAWGREFYTVPLLSRQGDRYRVIASQDDTKIFIGNNPVITHNKGEWSEFILSATEPTRIFADKPIMVAQYSHSQTYDNAKDGDPFMIILSPVTQAVNDVTFVTYTSQQIVKYFINIVTLTSEVNNIELNNAPMGSQFKPFPGTNYSYAQITVGQATYRLRNTNPDRGFLAYVYGFGGVESYGYGVGFNLDLVLDIGKSIDFQGDSLAVCKGKNLTLDAGPYFDNYAWSTGATTQKLQVSEEGMYKITASTVDGCIQHDSIYLVVNDPKINLGPDQSGCAPFAIDLDGGAGFESYLWNTGDTIQTLHADKTGMYHLEVRDWLDCPARDTMKLTVFPVPKADLAGDPLICGERNTPLAVNFSGTADSIWQQGNFLWETNKPGQLVFNNPQVGSAGLEVNDWGEYEIRYKLTTKDGCTSGDDFKTAFWQTPTSDFEFIESPGDKCEGYSREVLYTGNASPAAHYSWDFGGSTLTDSIDWNRLRVSVGVFNSKPFLSLSVEEHGCYSDTTRKPIGANPDFSMNTLKSRGCDSARIFFSGDLKIPDALKFEWDFGDGSPVSNLEKPSHLYNTVGDYDVSLQITNELTGCKIGFRIDSMVRVFPTPVAKISADPTVCYGDTLSLFYVGSIDSSFCTWDLDGAREIGKGNDSIVVRIEKPVATIRLQTEEFGCPSLWVETTVKRKPDFDFMTDPAEGCQPLQVALNAISDDQFLAYTWLTDTLSLTGEKQLINISDTGRITMVLLALSSETGCRDTVVKPGWIWVHPKPLAQFIVDFPVALLGQSNLNFTNQSQYAVKFDWDFGDESHSSEVNPKHNFTELGKFPVSLLATTGFGCLDTATMDIEILPDEVFTPNAFRPDSHIPENCTFMPITVGVDPAQFHLLLFNRWGAVVFESKNLENKWDGKLKNGQQAPPGNYIWKAEYTDIQGFRHSRMGQVLLVR